MSEKKDGSQGLISKGEKETRGGSRSTRMESPWLRKPMQKTRGTEFKPEAGQKEKCALNIDLGVLDQTSQLSRRKEEKNKEDRRTRA